MNLRKSKLFSGLLVTVSLVLLMGLLAACGGNNNKNKQEPAAAGSGNNEQSNERVTIQFAGWGDPSEKEVFTKLIEAFQSKNPNIKVDYLHIPSGDYVGKMNTILAGGNAPDVFYVPDGDFGRWVSQGLLLPIDEYVKNSNIDLDDMWESGLARYRYDGASNGQGNLYGLPKDIGPTVLYYNKDLFAKMSVPFPDADSPMGMEKLLETAKKLTVVENGKTVQYGMGPIWWEGFAYGNGGKFLSDDKREFIGNSQETIDALQFAADLTNVHGVVPSSAALKDLNDGEMFKTGKLAMMITGRWMVPEFRKLSFDWDVAPLPTKEWGGTSGSVGLSIYSKSKNVEAAYKLVEYLGGPEGQKEQSLMGFSIPSFMSMANTDVFLQPGQKPEHAEVFIKAAEVQVAGPWTNLPNAKWYDMLAQGLAPMWEGKKTADQLLNDLKPKIDAAIKEGNPALFK
ncbi:sugar ABC transporter substrate-binding protein [Paenibacillus sp. MSJ-34]|uniref:ABC transporter substrate-binding protein n=1 Tax=Paenibacillus sp. MSJ-34 TaxID=2841529 RepID=UPI001C108DBC|nr:sugar ABC transporter substrate-binding protein [Paenibacillus sp. MSJ-34]MBU5441617.1 sugar ABC transporter substrate-binding protein [Paenibacillus sp. MSJ-34]